MYVIETKSIKCETVRPLGSFCFCMLHTKHTVLLPSQICETIQNKNTFFWMKNEVYYKQRQRAVSGHLAAVSSVQTTPFWIFVSWLLPSGHWVFGFQQHPTPFVVPHFPPVACCCAPPHPPCTIAPSAFCVLFSSPFCLLLLPVHCPI